MHLHPPRLALLLSLPLLFSSCEDSEMFFLINPDGSGRVTTKEIFQTPVDPDNEAGLGQAAIATMADLVLNSDGVDAWEEFSYRVLDLGRVEIETTALFADISKLRLLSTAVEGMSLASGMQFDRGGADRLSSIQLRSPATNSGIPPAKKGQAPDEATIRKEIQKTRDFWTDAVKNIRPEFGNKRAKVTLHFSGEIESQSNFTKEAKNQVSLEVTAPKMIDLLERMIFDDQLATDFLKTGAQFMTNDPPPIAPEMFNELAFGEAGPIRVEFRPGPALFDYLEAVELAKATPSPLVQTVLQMAADARGPEPENTGGEEKVEDPPPVPVPDPKPGPASSPTAPKPTSGPGRSPDEPNRWLGPAAIIVVAVLLSALWLARSKGQK